MKKILILGMLLFMGTLLFAQQNVTNIGKIETNGLVKVTVKIENGNFATIVMSDTQWVFNKAAQFNLKKMFEINLHMVDVVNKNNLKVVYERRTDLFAISSGVIAYSFFSTNVKGDSFITLRFIDQHSWTEKVVIFSPDEIKKFITLIDDTTISLKNTDAAIALLDKELALVSR